ncbi:hypothetical protein niasHT_005966 [Heterodera trifolii]|uniref:Effector protein n=1 Tax=Heterodera trifolii TaxID=157864 RepID=A0ABD2LWS5_9BILA
MLIFTLQFFTLTCYAKKEEVEKLLNFMCRGLNDEFDYRKSENWRKIGQLDYSVVPKEKFADFMDWQIRYASIEHYLDYCKYLKNCNEDGFFCEILYENNEQISLQQIAIQPRFFYAKHSIWPINEVMKEIVRTQKQFFVTTVKKSLKICEKCNKIIPLYNIHFENKENCVKALAWAKLLKNNADQSALSVLRKIKTNLLSNADGKNMKLIIDMPILLAIPKNDTTKQLYNNFEYMTEQDQYDEKHLLEKGVDELQFQFMLYDNKMARGNASGVGSVIVFDICDCPLSAEQRNDNEAASSKVAETVTITNDDDDDD